MDYKDKLKQYVDDPDPFWDPGGICIVPVCMPLVAAWYQQWCQHLAQWCHTSST